MKCCYMIPGSISNIDDSESKCPDGSTPVVRNKVISGVVGASSSVTSIQVANLLRLFKIPQVIKTTKYHLSCLNGQCISRCRSSHQARN